MGINRRLENRLSWQKVYHKKIICLMSFSKCGLPSLGLQNWRRYQTFNMDRFRNIYVNLDGAKLEDRILEFPNLKFFHVNCFNWVTSNFRSSNNATRNKDDIKLPCWLGHPAIFSTLMFALTRFEKFFCVLQMQRVWFK